MDNTLNLIHSRSLNAPAMSRTEVGDLLGKNDENNEKGFVRVDWFNLSGPASKLASEFASKLGVRYDFS